MGKLPDFDWDAFRRDIDDYERFLMRATKMSRPAFYREARRQLISLYAKGCAMPHADKIFAAAEAAGCELDGGAQEGNPEWLAEWKHYGDALSAFIGRRDVYYEAYDPRENDCGQTTLSNDLAEVLVDLKETAMLWDEGLTWEAMWRWSYFTGHWGEHATGALRALHALIGW